MRRGHKRTTRSVRIGLWCSEQEYQLIRRAAEETGQTVSSLLRRLALEYARRVGVSLDPG